ncbi:MAG: hypothetical protein A2W61_02940 [Deltaproteobacteria bacterium RIFCSPLOWO2_01_44_7]|nr:MAG: hypothetical protein A2712_07455 [Deltaproteobacteria bacterium RIFCSPHIGHO2_01_FULL_43_49]OGQ14819.1 MAG: hypothetical protein A3D22_09540 [Deltaproteobacteria bacterium RIFCSPHIGHO2_02_FULL_44_53]OGQ28205.1 MAG: hypothetical protein A3D98_08250 [Deltaproteobacteria bacterium RIFCSPHIGHO2_12_FULL_44_21]OGQ31417.1 MAG: hypothetical protein A2979_08300 [Deltaproteobacteria bacterium RIFCSPLOWO2_01_FULL_45_74]OGQ38417.1 MAG: hypothetical protein A2W61_02940 [Deltaproteobacteria bacterium 
MKKYISAAEAAKRLGISRMQVIRKIKKGEIPAQKVGHTYAISEESLSGIFRTMTESEKKRIEEAVHLVIQQYGDVIRRLGKE